MSRVSLTWTFLMLAVVLLFLGLWRDTWWPLAGGICALAAAAWLFTDSEET